jgi:hypothetical protein
MKLTWFGGTTVRIHIGGAILVIDPAGAPLGIDAAELVSGADEIIQAFGDSLQSVDPLGWKPRRPARLLDEGDVLPPVEVWSAAPGIILIDAIGEPTVVLTDKFDLPELGRWAEKSVFVLLGSELRERTLTVREEVLPRLIVLAGSETEIDEAFQILAAEMSDTGLVAMEPGLALEV